MSNNDFFTTGDLNCLKYFCLRHYPDLWEVIKIMSDDQKLKHLNSDCSDEIFYAFDDFLSRVQLLEQSLNSNKLSAFQDIAEYLVGVRPVSINDCRIVTTGYYINIFDYVDRTNHRKREIVFRSLNLLRDRCKEVGFYPIKRAKSKNFQLLLQVLF
jgi:hypothetical protein